MNAIIDQFMEYIRHHKLEEMERYDINGLIADVVESEGINRPRNLDH